MGKHRIAVAGVYHETNTFAPGSTDLSHFSSEWVSGEEAFVGRYAGTATSMGGVIDAAKELGLELLPGLYAQAVPGGMVTASAAERIIRELVESVDEKADGVVMILHGAMVAEGMPDVEAAILERLRAKMGKRPIAVTVDMHGNLSSELVRLADVIVGYDTYPHVDVYDRAVEATKLLSRCLDGSIHPVRSFAQPGLLVAPQAMQSDREPMKRILNRAFEMERDPLILNVTVAGGFPYSDVPDAGFSVIVSADGDEELAGRYADELCRLAWELRDQFRFNAMEPQEAVAEAVKAGEGTVILVESSDNVGGGSPADGTHLLPHLLEADAKSLIMLHDAEAAILCHRLGVGAQFTGLIGGKSDLLHGNPVEVKGQIRLLSDGHYVHVGPYMTGQRAEMGLSAVIETGNLTIVLTEKRVAPWDIGHMWAVGLRPEAFKVIVVKSAIAWRTAFGGIAGHVIEVDSPGCCSGNLSHFRYSRLRRPIYPLDDFEKEDRA